MKTKIIIAACLVCAATSALAQMRPGPGVVGSMGGNGAITNLGVGAYGTGTQTPGSVEPRTPVPAAADTRPSAAPATIDSTDRAAAPTSTPVLDGAIWGSARPSAEPATAPSQGQN